MSSSQSFWVVWSKCRLCTMPITINRAKIMYISSTVTSSHFLILQQNVKGLILFKISCWAYQLVLSTMSCTRAISRMFSNAFTTSNSAVLNLGPYTSQNVFREAGNEPIFYNTNLFDTPLNPKFMFSSWCSSLPLIMWVPGVTNCV
jgi:hypothetical protein